MTCKRGTENCKQIGCDCHKGRPLEGNRMTPRMTPERRAECDAMVLVSQGTGTDTRFEARLLEALKDCLTEIDALTADNVRLRTVNESFETWIADFERRQIETGKTLLELQSIVNQLAAELRKREGR